MRFFNTAGPINPEDHYYVPHRLDEARLFQLIEQKKYFVLHAPRQSGKTTAIRMFVECLNATTNYKAFYINVEAAQAARSNISEGLRTILNRFKVGIEYYFGTQDPAFEYLQKIEDKSHISGNDLYEFLHYWSHKSDKPLILFIDEIDSLNGDTLISVLRQIRDGYIVRPHYFPQSICLIGVRDVRDYQIWSETNQNLVLGGSAFNIKAESIVLPNFSIDQVRMLYLQHSNETNQKFTNEAIEYAFYLTQGQPWLINALAYQACFVDVTDRNQPITKEIIDRAKETLILRRDTHIDQLVHKLHEPRVREIIDAIIAGKDAPEDFPTDNVSYVIDLGLVERKEKNLVIANPIYQEIIPRELNYITQLTITQETKWYQNSDGSLNMHKLFKELTQFYRENSEIWLEKFNYKESGPHLLIMAFLQRVINGGGKIHREYALGRKRVDLLILWPYYAEATKSKNNQRIVIELKIKRSEKTLIEGLEQTAEYMDTNNATEGHLIIFDPTPNISWEQKIYYKKEYVNDALVHVWGM